jgi:hypothetical protein
MIQPPLGFVLVFLLFSLLFLSNAYKLWFKTDEYYQDIYNGFTDIPSLRGSDSDRSNLIYYYRDCSPALACGASVVGKSTLLALTRSYEGGVS